MVFRDFEKTEEFQHAKVIRFMDIDGNELDTGELDAETLGGREVAERHIHDGRLEIILH